MPAETFIPLLKEQPDLHAKLKDLQRRIGQALEAERRAGYKDRILVSHEGVVYAVERPGEPLNPADSRRFCFKVQGGLLP